MVLINHITLSSQKEEFQNPQKYSNRKERKAILYRIPVNVERML